MVVPADGADIAAIAAAHGSSVLRAPGRAHLATLAVPEGVDRDTFLQDLHTDPAVHRAGRQGVTRGASAAPNADDQWHLDISDFDESPAQDLSGVVVAVLDTGAAYENHTDSQRTYVAAPCLATALVVSPRDVVNQDAHPNDDHQHGTHISSLIVADCAIEGTAPGATLMPVKVLDQDNSGVESDLIEGIYWAVDHGAHVINMSLTFGPDYVPSPDLLDALDAAEAAGIVMVGAVGNDGIAKVGWPAASPRVIGVGAGCITTQDGDEMEPAPYSNHGPEVDVMAPGGCLDRDINEDGMPDGMLAEGIATSDGSPGYWLIAGTSQAAAVISGAAARLIAEGLTPASVRLVLQDQADESTRGGGEPFETGHGAGALDMNDSIHEAQTDANDYGDEGYSAALLPMLRDNGDGTVTPGARWSVVNERLDPAERVTVYGTIAGQDGRVERSCWMPDNGPGECTIWGNPVPAADAEGPRALGWKVQIDRIANDDLSFTPSGLLYATDELEALVEEANDDSTLSDAVLGIYWDDGDFIGDDELVESWVVLTTGTGIATSPFGVILTPPLINPITVETTGTGIATSPFGVRILAFEGTGIATSPFGLTVMMLRGSGIATSPFGALADERDGENVDPFCMGGDLQLGGMDANACTDRGFSGQSLRGKRGAGGWLAYTGESGAQAVAGSGLLSLPAVGEHTADQGASVGSIQLPE